MILQIFSFLMIFLAFTSCEGGGATTPVSVSTGGGSVAPDQALVVTFQKPINVSTVTTTSLFVVTDTSAATLTRGLMDSTVCNINFSLDAIVACSTNKSCVLTPTNLLLPSTNYRICLTNQIQYANPGVDGIFSGYDLRFTTNDVVLDLVTLSPSEVSLDVEDTQLFAVTGTYDDDTTQTLSSDLVWSSSNTSVVTVNQTGLATAVALGTANVMVTHSASGLTDLAVANVDFPVGGVFRYTVGGTLSGLTGTVVLQVNGADNLSLSGNGAFTFDTSIADGATYAVTVLTQPAGQTCTVTNGSGTLGGAAITNVAVLYTDNTYSVGGTISGLTGTIVLQNNSGDNLSTSSNGAFTFSTELNDAAAYDVTVLTLPAGQTCTLANTSGTVSSANITNVTITCTTTIVLFHTTGPTFGHAIGSRANADSLCSNSVGNANLSCTTVHAFLSVDGADEIRDMPANYSVPTGVTIKANTGTTIANDWADLLDGSIQTSLDAAMGHGLPNVNFWWSGSNADGSLNAACSGWTVGFQNGTIARGSTSNGTWINNHNSSCNGDNLVLLCLCY